MYYWIRYCKPGLDVCSIDTLLFSQRMRVLHAGNICRSPTAEAVFRAVVDKADRKEHFNIDSCGTGGGNPDWCAVYLVLLWPNGGCICSLTYMPMQICQVQGERLGLPRGP